MRLFWQFLDYDLALVYLPRLVCQVASGARKNLSSICNSDITHKLSDLSEFHAFEFYQMKTGTEAERAETVHASLFLRTLWKRRDMKREEAKGFSLTKAERVII